MPLCCQKTSMNGSQSHNHITESRPRRKTGFAFLQRGGIGSQWMKTDKTQGGAKRGCGELGKEFLALKSLSLCDGQGLGAQLGSDNCIEIPNQLCDFG